MGATWVLLHSLADQAAAVAALPASGALPVRTVLVPTERDAHALRRALVRTGRSAALAGTRFVGPLTLAREVLAGAGCDFTPGEESLRAARLLAVFEKDLPLEYFELTLLRGTQGWPDAFASAIGDLEGSGLSPARLPATSKAWRDVALLWREVDSAAGRSFTAARIFLEASSALQKGARAATGLAAGPILVAVTGRETAAERRRLVYVAATRAKELLVVPVAGGGSATRVTTALVGQSSPALDVQEEWTDDKIPAWAKGVKAPPVRVPKEAAAMAEAGMLRFPPKGVSTEAHERIDRESEGAGEAGERRKLRESRFGPVFGDTVHRAIGISLREPGLDPARAVRMTIRETGLGVHLAEAAADVARALGTACSCRATSTSWDGGTM